ncbi:MAG: ribosome small subunit-dependent GTPase A [Actinobacteria bacterium]|nr:ribosome small subunit-dependent GTPase A [Actinomycetota bacterium]
MGWSPFFEDAFEPYAAAGLIPARITAQHRGAAVLVTADGELRADVAGRLSHEAESGEMPAVGDWVAVRPREEGRATIHAVLPRRTKFSRKEALSRTAEQVVAANIDTVFLVSGLGPDLSARRLERYLTMAWESGAEPVIVLTKIDLVDDVAASVAEIESIAFGVPVHAVNGITGEGLEQLAPYLAHGRTVALLGSSGVGKSTLVNRLYGQEILATRAVRESDGTGRHTTTHRELVLLPQGGLLLDTPGMRELQLWEAEGGLEGAFADITALAATCRFSDCAHRHEPGCAVLAALEQGELAPERLESYRKLQRELLALEARQDARLAAEERRRRRTFAKSLRTDKY